MNLWRGYCSSLLSHLLHNPPPENYSSHHLTDPHTLPLKLSEGLLPFWFILTNAIHLLSNSSLSPVRLGVDFVLPLSQQEEQQQEEQQEPPIRNLSFKGSFLATSRTDSDSHGDICPSNICPGDICPYQEYLSCY